VRNSLFRDPRARAAALCSALVLLAGCAGASAPKSSAGVRSMYRAIGLDASSGEFADICRSYMDSRLRSELTPFERDCLTTSFERWAEKIRVPGIGAGTRILVAGDQALVYRATTPEKAIYTGGQWQLAEVPQAILPRRGVAR
jgi:hypothetical protein